MLKRERLRNILEIVTDRRFVTVDELARELQVSDMTIRRDLNELNTTGKVMRIHGGAQVISQQDSVEKNYMTKKKKSTFLKNKQPLKLQVRLFKMAKRYMLDQEQP